MRRVARALRIVPAACLCLLCFAPVAGAAVPEPFGAVPEDGKPGEGAGQLSFPLAVAAEAGLPGHLYAISFGNNRIDELTPWGEFVKAWGWGVDKTAPAEELQVCTGPPTGECRKGSSGPGRGEIHGAEALALGPSNNLYVLESTNHRVQRFDLEGHFLSMFGDGVNKTAIEESRSGEEDVCPVSGHPADVCQAGTAGTGAGQLGASQYESRLAVCGTDGRVFVGEGERIQVFAAGGAFEEAIAMPAGKSVRAIAVDDACNLYVAFSGDVDVSKLEASGPTAQVLEPTFPSESTVQALALGPDDESTPALDQNLYAVVFPSGGLPERVLEFGPGGACLDCGTEGEGGKAGFDRPTDNSALFAIATGAACGPTDIYVAHFGNSNPKVSYINIFGPHPDTALCPQPKVPPKIESRYTAAVGTESARPAAIINPEFWPDTTYLVQYGTAPCSEGGCKERPAAPGATLTTKVIRTGLLAEVPLNGLIPATTYHYRFVAKSGGGGPTIGEEGTFTTLPSPAAPKPDCSNRDLRAGPSANLPDCRAYEMVSPVDKNNGDIVAPGELGSTDVAANGGPSTRLDQTTPGGEALTYTSGRAFAGSVSSPWSSQYIARRGAGGWATTALNPPLEGTTLYDGGGFPFVESLFKGFSEDLCSGWLLQNTDLTLAPGAPKGIPDLYRESNCEGAGYQPLIATQPAAFGKTLEGNDSTYYPTLQEFSEDGSRAAFKAAGKLSEEAARTVVGESLDCSFKANGTTSAFGWLRNGVVIASATKSTYVTKKADEGKAIQCQVTVVNKAACANTIDDDGDSKIDYEEDPDCESAEDPTEAPGEVNGSFVGSVQMSDPAEIVAPYPAQAPPRAPASIAAPKSDTPLTLGGGGGQTLTCDAEEAKWGGSPGSFAYQWYRNGTALAGQTASTYSVGAADVATPAAFQCAVTATNAGGATSRASANLTTVGPEPDPPAPIPNPGVNDVYETWLDHEGELHLVSVMPGGQAAGSHSSVGKAQESAGKRLYDSVAGALSEDGSRVFWSEEIDSIVTVENEKKQKELVEEPPRAVHAGAAKIGEGASRLYLRVNAGAEQSALEHATGTGKLEEKSNKVTGVVAGGGTFAPGQTITGVGIPAGTMIEEVAGTTLMLSREALENKTGAALDAVEGCSEAEKACTVQITKGPSVFLAADPEGSKALYTEGTSLYELDADKAAEEDNAAGARTLVAGDVPAQGAILGASKDLSRVYVVSKEICSGTKENSERDKPQPGKPNLYLYETGEQCGSGDFDFVATLSGHNDVGAYTSRPVNHRSRVSPDGLHATFMSQAPLTGFDNSDAASGEADTEVFLYDAPGSSGGGEEGELRCVSCNITGARPTGRNIFRGIVEVFWVAAQLPGWENQWHPSRLLSNDGSRVFFESFEALVSRDTNGAQDVYEWERSAGEEDCLKEIGGELYVPASGGCISLISAGKGGSDAEFLDASVTGRDVFFATGESLVPGDPGLVDIYDAREEGGFEGGQPPPQSCEGDSCQPPAVAPEDKTPGSGTFQGQGNLKEAAKPRCPKGKHLVRRAGKKRCVSRKHRKKHVRRHGRSGR